MATHSWTADVHSQCIGKEGFDTPRAAAKAKDHIARRWNAKRRDSLEAYRCQYCSKWHLGRPVQQNAKVLKRDHARLVKRGKLRNAESHPSR